ncbi:MAG TPA: protein-L-isoaspartate(D-aspartate) O-methyltransferase [Elusimicrobiales bacterium]|jgi:protein-L-isoaspartate(D-aspartate) O-methyltransferase|nr:protein-L-isoaspartate(D-aspartate) O-methyltransferase [Elusimicrobiales bacterium]HOL62673.1 protein-L-isoaspartate(D-aspartate) O-methyltransferase [Elusimicrobiales bacterium]HPO95221.1 protein-L-isoaspartate(D-aspartate) O-methyltransferase [Elusimicrobiales bacterium]
MDINKILSEKYEKYFDYLNQKMITEHLIKRGIKNSGLLDAIKQIKRHDFLPNNLKTRAYDDAAIEILPGQTISQPYITAFMIELLDPQKEDKVLEIGTGTGWQTAILSKLSKEVYSIDIRKDLYEFSKKNIEKYGCENIKLKIGDGYKGWEEFAPFDKIILSCAPEDIPNSLIAQLKNNGKMVLPCGKYDQKLKILAKNEKGDIETKDSLDVVFVKMEKFIND